jgi:hypothetical protein
LIADGTERVSAGENFMVPATGPQSMPPGASDVKALLGVVPSPTPGPGFALVRMGVNRL